MKKLLLFAALSLWLVSLQWVFAIDVDEYLNGESPYDSLESGWWVEAVDLGKELQDLTVGDDGVVRQLLTAMWFKELEGENVAVKFISNIINFFLVTIGLVALAIMIFWFYKMFFGSDQAWFDSAKKLILNTVIAILVIGLAWFITNFLFDLFFVASEGI